MAITWNRSVLTKLDGIYCLEVFHTSEGIKIVAASEVHDGVCKMIDFNTGREEEVWPGPGGCMNVSQWNEQGDIVAVHNFYKGAQALDALVAGAQKKDGKWYTRNLAQFPYLHRCGVTDGPDGKYVIASTLCTERKGPGDWSHPGKIHLFQVPEEGQKAEIRILKDGVVKNHGFWQGKFDNQNTTLISGNALYAVRPPQTAAGEWTVEPMIEREISDVTVQDIDGDGEDELLVFEGLHGNEATINKRENGQWKVIASYPMKFAHAIWGGELLGKPSFVTGSMKGDGELTLVRAKGSGENFEIERIVLEKGIGPSNCRGFVSNGRSYILAAAREAGELVMYELSED